MNHPVPLLLALGLQLMSLEATFLAPMREFVKRELKEVKDQKDEIHRSHEEYLLQLQRFLKLPRGRSRPCLPCTPMPAAVC